MTTFKSYLTLFKLSLKEKYKKFFSQNRIIEKNIEDFFNRDVRFFYSLNNVYNFR